MGSTDARDGVGPPDRAAVLEAVDRLVDRACTLEELEYHGLQIFAARRWRATGRPVPARLAAQERAVATASMAVPALLRRIRSAYDGQVLLLKGPEVAVVYPDPALRPYADVDLLVADSRAAQLALMAAGFEPVGDEGRYIGLHHLRPLRAPGFPLLVEVHHAPKWPRGRRPPTTAELLELGVPARCSEGFLALPPAQHALVLAAHSWAHAPLQHLRHLLDVALVAADAGPTDWRALATRWDASRFWGATVAALNALFAGARPSLGLRLWGRHLAAVRERTVAARHLTSWISPLSCLPPVEGLTEGATAFLSDLRPLRGERWGSKVERSRLALANASVSAWRHDTLVRELGLEGDAVEPGDAA